MDHRAVLEAWVFALGRAACFEYNVWTPHHDRHQKVADHRARMGQDMPAPMGDTFALPEEHIILSADEAALVREHTTRNLSKNNGEELHVTADGEAIAVCEMTNAHLRNSVKRLRYWQKAEPDSFKRRELRGMIEAFKAELTRRGVAIEAKKVERQPEIDFAALWRSQGLMSPATAGR